MRNPKLLIGLAACLVAAVAIAANVDGVLRIVKGGIQIGATGTTIEDSYAATATIDYQPVDAGTCYVGAAVTVTGAAAADGCVIGPNATAGALDGVWTCFVSATNAVKPKFCNPTLDVIDPASGSYSFRVIDP